MKRTRRLIAFLLACLTPLLASCSGIVPDLASEPIHIAATPAAQFGSSALPAASDTFVEQTNEFAFRFTEKLLDGSDSGANFVCSPFSAWLPLAALVNATDAESRPQLLEALGEAGLSAERLNDAARALLSALARENRSEMMESEGLEPHNPLSIANAVFVDQEARVNSSFAETFARDYGGAAMSVDFSSDEAVRAINQWASDHTDGLIPEILAPGTLGPETVAAIANAIYFSDRWDWEFQEEDTASGPFHSPGGDTQAQFMLHDGELPYFEDDAMQAVRLDFVTGGSLLVMLPKKAEASALLAGLTQTRLTEVLSGMSQREGHLLLPRFEVQSGIMQLNDALQALGVPLFDSASPALHSLVDGQDVFLSQAVQSAILQVDEHGTTAAAVTALILAGAALPEPAEAFEMICNKPFAFVLLGPGTGLTDEVLFTGVVCDPSQ